MPLTVTIDAIVAPGAVTQGDRRLKMVFGTMAFDDNYPANGEALPSNFPISTIKGMKIENKAGYIFECDRTNKKIKAFTPTAVSLAGTAGVAGADNTVIKVSNTALGVSGTGTAAAVKNAAAEVADTTNLSALTGVAFCAWGY